MTDHKACAHPPSEHSPEWPDARPAKPLVDQIIEKVGGLPCSGHEDLAAGAWTFHREGECPE